MNDVERAIEQLIDSYLNGYDFSDLISEVKSAVLEEVQAEFSSVDELEGRIKDLEDKLERMVEALK